MIYKTTKDYTKFELESLGLNLLLQLKLIRINMGLLIDTFL